MRMRLSFGQIGSFRSQSPSLVRGMGLIFGLCRQCRLTFLYCLAFVCKCVPTFSRGSSQPLRAFRLHRCALTTLTSLWLRQARPGRSSASFGYRIMCLWRLWFLCLDHVLSSCFTLNRKSLWRHTYTCICLCCSIFPAGRVKCAQPFPLASSNGGQMRSQQNNQGFNTYLINMLLPSSLLPASIQICPLGSRHSY